MKVPEPRRLPSGTWFIQMRLGGVSVPVSAPTRRACIETAQLIKAEHRAGKRTIKRKDAAPTLGEAIDEYIETRRNVLSPATIDGYKRIRKKRFAAVMDKPISAEIDWQAVVNDEAAICGAKTLRNAYGLIKSVLAANSIRVPNLKLPALQAKPRGWLEPEEIEKLIPAADGTPAALPVFLALHSLRRSEILALTWDDIDLDKKCITVAGAVVQNEDHKYVRKDATKTEKSSRTLPIMIPELLVILSSTPADARTGAVVDCKAHAIADRINAACRSAGVPEVGTHGLRHSFASLAYHLGLSELETMELGGWADANTMRKIYTHLATADRLKAENKMAAFYAKGPKDS